jgi:membrane protein required for colicin V production
MEFSNLITFDIIILVFITFLGLKGFFHGFIKEIFSLLSLIGGIFFASRVANNISGQINEFIPIDSSSGQLLLAFILSFAFFWIIVYFIGNILTKLIEFSGLGIINNIFGFVIGGSKIFMIFSVIIYAVSNIAVLKPKLETKVKDSIIYPYLLTTGEYIINLDMSKLQSDSEEIIENRLKEIKEVK